VHTCRRNHRFSRFPGLRPGSNKQRVYVLFLKTPLPLLLTWGLAVAVVAAGRKRFSDRPWILTPLVFAGVFYGICLRSHLNIGVRHMLQCYPMMAFFSGVLLADGAGRFARQLRWGAVGLVVWLAAEAAMIFPLDLSYFNELCGGPTGGIRYLGDSNVDWGQDLKRLRRVLQRRDIGEIISAYLGNTDPAFYGIRYQYLPVMFFASAPKDFVVDGEREILAVSVNNLQGTLYAAAGLSDPLAWLRARKPVARAGYSIYLYDITGDAEAHRRLARLYRHYALDSLAEKEEAKAAAYAAGRRPASTAIRPGMPRK